MKQSQIFVTEYNTHFDFFMQNYNDDMLKYQNNSKKSKPLNSKNYFSVSCIPWTNFTGFNLNLQQGYEYLLQIFTIGKILLPLAIQVHGAVCDGFHLSRFINDLNDLKDWVDTFDK